MATGTPHRLEQHVRSARDREQQTSSVLHALLTPCFPIVSGFSLKSFIVAAPVRLARSRETAVDEIHAGLLGLAKGHARTSVYKVTSLAYTFLMAGFAVSACSPVLSWFYFASP